VFDCGTPLGIPGHIIILLWQARMRNVRTAKNAWIQYNVVVVGKPIKHDRSLRNCDCSVAAESRLHRPYLTHPITHEQTNI
jgi:hypothetical protein